MAKILVTGSEGFIGRNLIKVLQLMPGEHEIVKMDIRDRKNPSDIRNHHTTIEDLDVVFHLAACSDARSENSTFMMDVNVTGTARLARKYGNRMIFASSLMARHENSPYAISKRAGEMLVNLYGGTVVRLPNVFGPGGHSVIDVFRENMKKGKVATINGSGEQLRQYIHVTDAISELITATVSCERMRQVNGKPMTVLEVAEFFDLKTEHVSPVMYDPMLGY